MRIYTEVDSIRAFQIAKDEGLADEIINAKMLSDEPNGVLTLIATDNVDKYSYLVVQLYYGHEDEDNNGWLVAQYYGPDAHNEVAQFVEFTMEDPKLLEVLDDGYKM